MKMSFIIYSLAVILNTFFAADFALTPLFASFGSIVLCYVAGNKAVEAFEHMCPSEYEHKPEVLPPEEQFIKCQDDTCPHVCKSLSNEQQVTSLITFGNLLKKKQAIMVTVNAEGKIVSVKKAKIS